MFTDEIKRRINDAFEQSPADRRLDLIKWRDQLFAAAIEMLRNKIEVVVELDWNVELVLCTVDDWINDRKLNEAIEDLYERFKQID